MTLNGDGDDDFKADTKRSLGKIEEAILDVAQTLHQFRRSISERIDSIEAELKGLRTGIIKDVVSEAIRTVPCPALVGLPVRREGDGDGGEGEADE